MVSYDTHSFFKEYRNLALNFTMLSVESPVNFVARVDDEKSKRRFYVKIQPIGLQVMRGGRGG